MQITRALNQSSERGQSFVELGVSLVILLLLVAVVIDLGWAFFTMVSLRDAAQEAASYASVCPAEVSQIQTRAYQTLSDSVDTSDPSRFKIDICVADTATGSCNVIPQIGGQVTVTLTYQHQIMAPLLGTVNGSQMYPLKVTATDKILQTWCQAN